MPVFLWTRLCSATKMVHFSLSFCANRSHSHSSEYMKPTTTPFATASWGAYAMPVDRMLASWGETSLERQGTSHPIGIGIGTRARSMSCVGIKSDKVWLCARVLVDAGGKTCSVTKGLLVLARCSHTKVFAPLPGLAELEIPDRTISGARIIMSLLR